MVLLNLHFCFCKTELGIARNKFWWYGLQSIKRSDSPVFDISCTCQNCLIHYSLAKKNKLLREALEAFSFPTSHSSSHPTSYIYKPKYSCRQTFESNPMASKSITSLNLDSRKQLHFMSATLQGACHKHGFAMALLFFHWRPIADGLWKSFDPVGISWMTSFAFLTEIFWESAPVHPKRWMSFSLECGYL